MPEGSGRRMTGPFTVGRVLGFSRVTSTLTVERTAALLTAACRAIQEGVPEAPDGLIHRLDKLDTRGGLDSLQYVGQHHVPYAVLLYERYFGRPLPATVTRCQNWSGMSWKAPSRST